MSRSHLVRDLRVCRLSVHKHVPQFAAAAVCQEVPNAPRKLMRRVGPPGAAAGLLLEPHRGVAIERHTLCSKAKNAHQVAGAAAAGVVHKARIDHREQLVRGGCGGSGVLRPPLAATGYAAVQHCRLPLFLQRCVVALRPISVCADVCMHGRLARAEVPLKFYLSLIQTTKWHVLAYARTYYGGQTQG